MKNLLLDTKIVIDLLACREPFYAEAALLFSLADRQEIKLYVSALTFANTSYLLLRQKGSGEAKQILRKLRLLAEVLNLDEKVIDLALNDEDFKDFEDALQYFSANEYNLDVIITRNLKDFQKSSLPVMTAGQFIQGLKE
jgi:predicted nucleic acid-binding protein